MWLFNLFLILVIVFLISITWTNWRGAPWVPTSMKTVNKMLTLADVGPDDVVYDLGCGDGRTIITAARRYGARAVGVEIDPFRYWWCRAAVFVLGLGERVEVRFGDFFSHDLSQANVVTCYLLQDTNNELEEKFLAELRPGTRVVSNTFKFSKLQAAAKDDDARLYLR